MSEFESSVSEWLKNNDYNIVSENEEIQGKKVEYKARIHALSANQEYIKWAKIASFVGIIAGLAFFGGKSIPVLQNLMKDLGSVFGAAGSTMSFTLLIGGVSFYIYAKGNVDEHVWVELKDFKRKVNKTQIEKFFTAVQDVRNKVSEEAESEKLWAAKYAMMFSSKGFSAQALKLAESHKIDCLTWEEGSNNFIREVWSQAEPESEDTES